MLHWRLGLVALLAAGACTKPTNGKPSLCEAEACSGHGRCVVEGGQPRCECEQYYMAVGLSCVVNCLGINCSNHGGCIVVDNEPWCVCEQGFWADGLECVDNPPRSCVGQECSGHGVCVQVDNEPAYCMCELGWQPFGLVCVPANCQGKDCSGHGACLDAGGAPWCRCDPGYEVVGLGCVPADCSLTDCSGHGACVDEGGDARCVCDHGYVAHGLSCRPEACAQEDCSGHGACVADGAGLRCQCDPGYVADGLSCRPGCVEQDCSGHGACVQFEGVLRCLCDPGYEAVGESCVVAVPGGDSGVDGGGGDGGGPTAPGPWVLIDVTGTPFTMGAPEAEVGRIFDEVEHQVTLSTNYWMMATEITQQQFLNAMGYNPSYFSAGGGGTDCGPDCPVEQVSWHELAAYSNALSRSEGLSECYDCAGTAPNFVCSPSPTYATPYECPGYRLPTEAEWEYAARGGTTTATYNGNLDDTNSVYDPFSCLWNAELEPIAWWCGNAVATHAVAGKTPNNFGLYDMLGNVFEWCHDWYGDYSAGPVTNPWGPANGSTRITRGGFYLGDAWYARAALRLDGSPNNRFSEDGGRVVRSEL